MNMIDHFPAESAEAELWGAAKRGQGQAAAAPPGPRPGAGGSLVRGAEQQRRSRPVRGARRALRRDSAGRPQPAARTWGAKPRAPAKRGYHPCASATRKCVPKGRRPSRPATGAQPRVQHWPQAGAKRARTGGSRALRAPPQARRSRALEPEGREGTTCGPDAASSRGRHGFAATADSPQGCPCRWFACRASMLPIKHETAALMDATKKATFP